MSLASWYFLGESAQHTVQGHRLRLDGERAVDERGHSYPIARRTEGMYAWVDPRRKGAPFTLPHLEREGWTEMTFESIEVRTRPEVIMRDLADVLHFQTVHRYERVQVEEPLSLEGAHLRTQVAFHWDSGIPGLTVPARFSSEVWGVGYQCTEVQMLGGRLQSRHLVLPVPLDGERCQVHLGVSVRIAPGVLPSALLPAARFLMHHFLRLSFRRDVARDTQLWVGAPPASHQPDPGDATLAAFSDWTRQFLPREDSLCA